VNKQVKSCKDCGIELLARIHGQQFCQNCARNRERVAQKKINDKIRDAWHTYKIGLGCILCGYHKNSAALEFHHMEGKDHEVDASDWYFNNSKAKELEKCVLLCRNCHAEQHFLELNKQVEEEE